MEEIHFRIQPDQSAKKQALHAIKALKNKLSLARMKMRIRLAYSQEDSAEIEAILGEHTEEGMQVDGGRKVSVCLIDPDVYRKLNKLIGQPGEGKEERVRVEIVDASVADFPLPAQENFVTPAGPRKISGEEGKQEEVKVVVKPVVPVREEPPGAKKFGCTTCPGANFSGPGDQRFHFKSDWHKVNVKLKVAARPLLSEAEFQIIEPREFEYWMTLKNL
jgi:ribosome maturation protein SDO1